MVKIEFIEIYSSLVDESLMPFLDEGEENLNFDFSLFEEFISRIDVSKKGKLDVGENTRDLVEYLTGDDLRPPPRSLCIKFSINSKIHEISIPYADSTYIYVYS
ncbi:hypothetical protein JEZ13_08585 [bacterium]|nr:hypothetical protein [bacterium]